VTQTVVVADENIALNAISALRAIGDSVESIAEQMAGATDEAVLHHACSRNAALLTFDRDFGELIFKRMPPAPRPD
jgi:predicted nuclease of predicted toxin-antitoxin system